MQSTKNEALAAHFNLMSPMYVLDLYMCLTHYQVMVWSCDACPSAL